jgi:hypothetical protein
MEEINPDGRSLLLLNTLTAFVKTRRAQAHTGNLKSNI